MISTSGPLAGLRAVDVSGAVGTYVGRMLADLGVEVLRVRHPWDDFNLWPRQRRIFFEAWRRSSA